MIDSLALYETVSETGWYLEPQLAGIGSIRPDWQYVLADQAIYITWGCFVPKESNAYLDCH